MKEEKKNLQSGLKFPVQVNPATGRFEMIQGDENIKQSVYMILMTQKQERFIHPDFGSRLLDFTFSDGNRTMLQLFASDLAQDIKRGEPRVTEVKVYIEPDIRDGCLMIDVEYRAKESGKEDRLEIPFYLNQ